MPSLGSLLLLALIFVTLGFIGGVLVALLWRDRESMESESLKNNSANNGQHKELVKFILDRSDSKLAAQFGKDILKDPAMLNVDQQKVLYKIASVWLPDLKSAKAPEVDPPISEKTEDRISQVTDTPSKQPIVPPVGSESQQKTSVSGVQTGFSSAQNVLPVEIMTDKKPVRVLSIVEQIDEILQELLVKSGNSQRGIRLVEDPRGGVIVWVGIEKFDGIDSVSDDEVKKIIRSAVEKWERGSDKH